MKSSKEGHLIGQANITSCCVYTNMNADTQTFNLVW